MKDGAPLIAQGDIVQRQHRSRTGAWPGGGRTSIRSVARSPICSRCAWDSRRNSSGVKIPLISPVQIHDPVRNVHQVIEPVLCNQDGLALALDQPQMLPQFLDGGHVQVRRWFIQQIDLRVHGVDGCECDLLLFPAGQLEDIAAAKTLDAQILRRLLHPPASSRGGRASFSMPKAISLSVSTLKTAFWDSGTLTPPWRRSGTWGRLLISCPSTSTRP